MNPYRYMRRPMPNNYGNHFAGGFALPFVLGGITGGLLAPAFYPRPCYPYPNYPIYPNYSIIPNYQSYY